MPNKQRVTSPGTARKRWMRSASVCSSNRRASSWTATAIEAAVCPLRDGLRTWALSWKYDGESADWESVSLVHELLDADGGISSDADGYGEVRAGSNRGHPRFDKVARFCPRVARPDVTVLEGR